MADAMATGPRRVKVYVLNDDEHWDDRGTGHVRLERDSGTNAYVLRVVAENSTRVTLCSQVRASHEDFYHLQEDTIISWTEDDFLMPNGKTEPTEIALSFAEADGCRQIWDKICQLESLYKQQHLATAAKHMLSDKSTSAPPSQLQRDLQSHQDPSNPSLPSHLSLPLSISPHNDNTAADSDLLVSTGRSALPGASSAENNLQRNHLHATNPNHLSLVDAPTTADITHSSRFFDDMDPSHAWSSDPIEDVIFRESSSVLFLSGSPGSLVPPPTTTDALVASGFVMPEPTRPGVEVLSRIMSDQGLIQVLAVRERIVAEVSTGNYVSKLCQVFRACERSTDLEGLSMLYHVIRCLFIVGPGTVLEVLVNEGNLLDVVGCLEYDPERMAELERKQAEKKHCQSDRSDTSGKNAGKEGYGDPERHLSSDVSRSTALHSPDCSGDKAGALEKFVDCNTQKSARGKALQHPHTEEAHEAGNEAMHDGDDLRKDTTAYASGEKAELVESLHAASTSSAGAQTKSGDLTKKSCDELGPNTRLNPVKQGNGTTNVEDVTQSESPARKNLSEETTSSGNLIGEDGEGALVVRVHRDFLERQVVYKSVVPITDGAVLGKIHQNYRVAYIRDVILSRVFDEGVNGALSGVIVCNNVDIILYFISESDALQELFLRLKSAIRRRKTPECSETKSSYYGSHGCLETKISGRSGTPSVLQNCSSQEKAGEICEGNRVPLQTSPAVELLRHGGASDTSVSTGESNITAVGDPSTSKEPSSRALTNHEGKKGNSASLGQIDSDGQDGGQSGLRAMLQFLRELCNVVKGQQDVLKNRFHSLLRELGVLEVSVSLLQDQDPEIRSLCCDILSASIAHDQTEVRLHILKNVAPSDRAKPKRVGAGLRSMPVSNTRSNDDSIPVDQDLHCNVRSSLPRTVQVAIDTQVSTTVDGDQSVPLPSIASSASGPNGNCTEAVEFSRAGQSAEGIEAVPKAPLVSNQVENVSVLGCTRESSDSPQPSMDVKPQARRLFKRRWKSKPVASALRRRVDRDFPLLSAMVNAVCEDRESGVALTVLELLRVLLDLSNMRTASDKDVFLDIFYEKFAHRLLDSITCCMEVERQRVSKGLPCESVGNVSHICDLLSYCVGNHSYRSKYFVLGYNVGVKVAKLLEHRKAFVRLSALRLIRSFVGLLDNVYDRYIIREELFDPIMSMFRRNGIRDNLISSAVLEILSCVYTQRRYTLLNHLLSRHADTLRPSSEYCGAFEAAKKILNEMVAEQAANERQASEAGEEVLHGSNSRPEDDSSDVKMHDIDIRPDTTGLMIRAEGEREYRGPVRSKYAGVGSTLMSRSALRMPSDERENECTPLSGHNDIELIDFRALMDARQQDMRSVALHHPGGFFETGESVRNASSESVMHSHFGDEQNWNDKTDLIKCKPEDAEMPGSVVEKKSEGEAADPRSGKSPLVGYVAGDSDEEVEKDSAGKKKKPITGQPGFSQQRMGAVRISISKRDVNNGQLNLSGSDEGELLCESSEDSISPRKRERILPSRRGLMPGGGIETCTTAVMKNCVRESSDVPIGEECEESPPKRRRTEIQTEVHKDPLGGRHGNSSGSLKTALDTSPRRKHSAARDEESEAGKNGTVGLAKDHENGGESKKRSRTEME